MNFLTATVELVADDSKLNTQLAKVKQKVTKSVSDLENYFKKNVTHSFRLVTNFDTVLKKMDKMRSISGTLAWYSKKFGSNLLKVNNTTARATTLMKSLSGETIRINHALSGWTLRALDFHRRMKRNLALITKFASLVKNIAMTLGKGFMWPIEKMYSGIKRLAKASAEVAGEVNKGFVMPSLSLLLHPIKTLRAAVEAWLDEGQRHQTEWNDSIQETAERLFNVVTATNDVRDALREEAEVMGDINAQLKDFDRMSGVAQNMAGLGWERKARQETMEEKYKRLDQTMKSARDVSGQHGQQLQMVLFGVPGMFTAIYDAAKWAFGGIADITTSVFNRMINMSVLAKTGIIASLLGTYAALTKAAMDYEADQAAMFGGITITTRDALAQMKDAMVGAGAAIGKIFLPRMKAVALAIRDAFLKATPAIRAWADKMIAKMKPLELAFIDWVKFLSTDFKGGVSVALQVVSELFKGFAEALIVLMDFAGRRAGKALVEAFQGIITGLLPSAIDKADKALKWLGQKLLKGTEGQARQMQRLTGMPGPPQYQRRHLGPRAPTEEESAEGAISRIYRKRAENVKRLLKDMPTWGVTKTEADKSTENAKVIMNDDTAMAEHRRKMLEQGATLSNSQWAIQNERMIAESEYTSEKLKKAQDFAATRQGMLNALGFEYDLLGRTNDERERAIELANFQAELAKDTSLSMERQNELMDEYASKLDRLIAKQSSLGHTVQLWMNKAGEMGENLGNLLTTTFDRMADSLADALMGMEMDWKAFGRMFIKQLLAMIIKLQIAFALQTAMAVMSGGSSMAASGTSVAVAGSSAVNPMAVYGAPAGLQHGGDVLETGWAKVHKGERFSGVNNEQGFGGITVNNYLGDTVDVEVIDEEKVINITRRASIQMAAYDGDYRNAHGIGGR